MIASTRPAPARGAFATAVAVSLRRPAFRSSPGPPWRDDNGRAPLDEDTKTAQAPPAVHTRQFHWFLPTSGDGHHVGAATVAASAAQHNRPATIGYLTQVAQAAESAGLGAVLTPVGSGCPDPWILCSALATTTWQLRLLVAFRAGIALPTLLAQQAEAFQSVSGGRLALNVVTGGDAAEQRAYGDFLSHDERYARTAEYLEVLRLAWQGFPFDYEGAHYRIERGGLRFPLDPVPPVYFGGASPAAEQVAARQADTYLLWGEPPAAVASG